MTINKREAEANNDSDGCEHGIKQGSLGTEQRTNATAPVGENQNRRDNAEQHRKEREWPKRANPAQPSPHPEQSRQIESEECNSECQQRPEQNCGEIAQLNGLPVKQRERSEVGSKADHPRSEKDGDDFHGVRSAA